jgi:hypothetical protein
MSNAGIQKNFRTSTTRRHEAAERIKKVGIQFFEMGRCTPCQKSNSLCFVLKGRKRCSSCEKKNGTKCDGNFSAVEFDALERKKQEIKQQQAEQRAEVGRRAMVAAAAYAALSEAQQKEMKLESQWEKYAEAQSRMLTQELEALDDLEEEVTAEEETPVAVLSDGGVFWDGSAFVEPLDWDAMLRFPGDIPSQTAV